jgi:chorismate synthase
LSGNSFGNLFKITTFGESHGLAVGVIVDGCPAGLELSKKDIQIELDRRKPGFGIAGTKRKESDSIEILSGIFKGKTTGTPIAMVVYNEDHQSKNYDSIKNVFRPGHADFTYNQKYIIRDYRGGGRSSGRETLARVAGGAIAKKLLLKKKIKILGYTKSIGDVVCGKVSKKDILLAENNQFRCPDKDASKKMESLIEEVAKSGDSIGGIVELIVSGVPVGLGEPVFEKLDANIAKALMSIGAVKGIEIGAGFESSKMLGSENNDEMFTNGKKIVFGSNNSGGILGGISNGEDIITRIVVKPTPSIYCEQNTITVQNKNKKINILGRHDVCICPRIIPVAESMIAIVILNALLEHQSRKKFVGELK